MRTIFLTLFLYSVSILAQDSKNFELLARKDSIHNYLIAKNNLPTNVTFKIVDQSTDDILQKIIIPANDSVAVLDRQKGTKEEYVDWLNQTYNLRYHLGDSISSKPNYDYLYALPYQYKSKYKVIQSWGGKFSHSKPTSFHAIDFKMDIGEPIHAARSGIVVRSVEHFEENGGRELRNAANVIVLKHDDNTFAYYVHLKPEGSLVEIGQHIKKGDLIGYSGNTGFSTQPHLHFVVRDGSSNSIPIYFIGLKKDKLRRGKCYKNNFK